MAPSASSFVQPLPEETTKEGLNALVIFDFIATSEFELGVQGMSLPHVPVSTLVETWLCRWHECAYFRTR